MKENSIVILAYLQKFDCLKKKNKNNNNRKMKRTFDVEMGKERSRVTWGHLCPWSTAALCHCQLDDDVNRTRAVIGWRCAYLPRKGDENASPVSQEMDSILCKEKGKGDLRVYSRFTFACKRKGLTLACIRTKEIWISQTVVVTWLRFFLSRRP